MKKPFGIMLACLSMCAVFAGLTLGAQYYSAENGFSSSVHEERLELEGKRYIDVVTTNIDITVLPAEGDKIVVEYLGDTTLRVTETDDGVELKQSDDFAISLFTTKQFSYKLTVYLPEYDYRELYFGTSGGDVSISGIDSEFTEASTRTGAITLDNTSGRAALRTYRGNVLFSPRSLESSLVIENGHGTTEIVLPPDSSVALDYRTDSGLFTSSLFNKNYNGTSGGAKVNRGINRAAVTVTTDSGDLTIR